MNKTDSGIYTGHAPEEKIIIAGPCSAETEDQVMDTARALRDAGIHIFRAGVWKPRTRPGRFEGVGTPGLEWLKRVKKETGMMVTTEVANARHVEEAVNAGIDILWIGARTTTSPFAVQEIADSLRGTDIPVMVKNPVNPDIELWAGALERFDKAGTRRLAAIHRGFSTYGERVYRNAPQWQIPIELRRRMPELPILCDPSHISGCTDHILSISQTAMEMNADGLIVEVHCNPAAALSDASQQLTPAMFCELIRQLDRRRTPDRAENDEMQSLRSKIDGYDVQLLDILAKRMDVAVKIGEFKKSHGLTLLQSDRYKEIVRSVADRGRELGLSEDFIGCLYEAIHTESLRRQLENEK